MKFRRWSLKGETARDGMAAMFAQALLGIWICAAAVLFPMHARAEEARKLDVTLSAVTSGGLSALKDTDYETTAVLNEGDTLTITAPEGEKIGGVYLQWWREPDPFEYSYEDGDGVMHSEIRASGYLHDYLAIPEDGVTEVWITVEHAIRVCNVAAYSQGEPPAGVQVWQEPCYDGADFLVFSTHADDEILFLGGVLATYNSLRGYRTQIVYMTQFWTTWRTREHEKLDGLWEIGIRSYPVNGTFDDIYCGKDADSLAIAERTYSYDEVEAFLTEQIRVFRPLVVVTQGFNGEYGHGAHKLLAKAVAAAVDGSMNEQFHPESAASKGTWDVPKAYFHLYEENRLTLNLREPIEELGGRTAVEAAKDAYLKHVTQQYCWFYVSDDPDDPKSEQINCSYFGLYRTSVGADTGNDLLEHLVTYGEQERIAEEERLAQEARLAEEARIAEEERLEAERLAAIPQYAYEGEGRVTAEADSAQDASARTDANAPETGEDSRAGLSPYALLAAILAGSGLALAILLTVLLRRKRRGR